MLPHERFEKEHEPTHLEIMGKLEEIEGFLREILRKLER